VGSEFFTGGRRGNGEADFPADDADKPRAAEPHPNEIVRILTTNER
jgi:hypothetical protein